MYQIIQVTSQIFFLISISFAEQKLNPNKFPEGFKFGTATSAYQIEGAWNISGKGENIWDRFTHEHTDRVLDSSNGDIACDSYNKFRADVALLKEMGVHFYRFSLSWSRILPKGLSYKINPDGIRYYNQLIDLLLENGIEPMITIFHWDTPQFLEDLGGFTNELSINWFEEYAQIAFEKFGPRVKLWLTFNEPSQTCHEGYGGTNKAPAYNSDGIGDYLCAHNILKAHARVYHMYDKQYRSTQKGKIGISIDARWCEPKTNTTEDKAAVQRMLEFMFGWYADPIYSRKGNYPKVMRQSIAKRSAKEGFKKSRLPKFTLKEIEYIKGTFDFLGLNHYTTNYAEDISEQPISDPSVAKDARVKASYDPEWEGSAADWLKVVPWGFRKLLNWIKNRYGNIEIYITENGYADKGEIIDSKRIRYHKQYLSAVLDAIDDGVNIKAYTAWTLLDNFEWLDGYINKFGLHYVDFDDPERKRTPKASAKFFRQLIIDHKLPEQ